MFDSKRIQLYEYLPLSTPFSLHVFPSFYCNFKCSYCLHSLSNDTLREKGFYKELMDFDLFKKVVNDAGGFSNKIKALIFAGHGEPLSNPDIAKMVGYASSSGKFNRVEIVTNASLLSREMSDALIDSGIDRLRISLQGVNAQKYHDVSGVKLDYENFVDNIRYFYEKKSKTEVYIKIIDVAMDGQDDFEKFHRIFDEISDVTAIEYAIPFVKEIDLGDLSGKNKQGNKQASEICSMPFYMMVVNPNGDVVPCCATDIPEIFGNIRDKSLVEIWNSMERKRFLRCQLHGAKILPICQDCSVPEFGLQEGDYLDDYKTELLERLK